MLLSVSVCIVVLVFNAMIVPANGNAGDTVVDIVGVRDVDGFVVAAVSDSNVATSANVDSVCCGVVEIVIHELKFVGSLVGAVLKSP